MTSGKSAGARRTARILLAGAALIPAAVALLLLPVSDWLWWRARQCR